MVSQISKSEQKVEKERTPVLDANKMGLRPKICRTNPNLLKIDLSKNDQFSPSSVCLLFLTRLGTGTTTINLGIYIYVSVACSNHLEMPK